MGHVLEDEPPRPAVSVIIPTHNRAWALGRAIDSVLEQTWRDFELIVVDDGSTDETPFLFERYGAALRVIIQKRAGVSAARNRGVALARGGLIAFLDSDDYWLPEKLAAQVDFFATHPAALICQTREIWMRDGRRVNPGLRHQQPDGEAFFRSLELCLISPSAVMMRRELLDRVGGFDETLPAAEDYDLWLRIAAAHPVYLIDRPLLVKTGGHADQLSRTTAGLDQYRVRALEKILASGRLTAGQNRAAREVLIRKARVYGRGCLRRGREEEGRIYLELARRYEEESE